MMGTETARQKPASRARPTPPRMLIAATALFRSSRMKSATPAGGALLERLSRTTNAASATTNLCSGTRAHGSVPSALGSGKTRTTGCSTRRSACAPATTPCSSAETSRATRVPVPLRLPKMGRIASVRSTVRDSTGRPWRASARGEEC